MEKRVYRILTVAILIGLIFQPVRLFADDDKDELIKAVEKNRASDVRSLLKAQVNPNLRDEQNLTLLMKAAQLGFLATVTLLLEYDADPTLKNSDQKTARNLASKVLEPVEQEGSVKSIASSKRDQYISIMELLGESELIRACQRGDIKKVSALLLDNRDFFAVAANCRDIRKKTETFNMTPLMHASNGGFPRIIDLLLAHEASIDAHDKKGWTALMYGAKSGNFDVIQTLLDAKANPLAKNKEGELALDIAKEFWQNDDTKKEMLGLLAKATFRAEKKRLEDEAAKNQTESQQEEE